jgi:hypothetical protein
MRSLLLAAATTGVSRIAGWCWISVTPQGSAADAGPEAAAWGRGSMRAAEDGGCGRAADPAWGAQCSANYGVTRGAM